MSEKNDLKEVNKNLINATKQMGNATSWIATLTLVVILVSTIDIVFYYMTTKDHTFSLNEIQFIAKLGFCGLFFVFLISISCFFFGHNIWDFLFKRRKRKK